MWLLLLSLLMLLLPAALLLLLLLPTRNPIRKSFVRCCAHTNAGHYMRVCTTRCIASASVCVCVCVSACLCVLRILAWPPTLTLTAAPALPRLVFCLLRLQCCTHFRLAALPPLQLSPLFPTPPHSIHFCLATAFFVAVAAAAVAVGMAYVQLFWGGLYAPHFGAIPTQAHSTHTHTKHTHTQSAHSLACSR